MAHSNPYAKVCLLPDQKSSRQTPVEVKTQNPRWEQTFHFEMGYQEAERRTLEITVRDFDKYTRHCVIGQTHQCLENLNVVKGVHMWKPLQPCLKVSLIDCVSISCVLSPQIACNEFLLSNEDVLELEQ